MSARSSRDEPRARLTLGNFPTPVRRLECLPELPGELWLKDDGCSSELYGGNKVRKLERTLASALAAGSKRIVTVGAAGSHHVLATALFARRLGIETVAVLCPQPWTSHAERVLLAVLGLGVDVKIAKNQVRAAWQMAREYARGGGYLLPPGGSNTEATLGYVDAVHELSGQIRQGTLPEPDVIVAALGSGGTVAGILAGVTELELRSRVLGVSVATGPRLARLLTLGLARAALARLGNRAQLRRLSASLWVDGSELGAGYGHPTRGGESATEVARGVGLGMDPTYTSKAFSAALRVIESLRYASAPAGEPGRTCWAWARASRPPLRVLYWHTLSTRSPDLLDRPAFSEPLPAPLRALLPRR
jgi:D-cysteine desulfhydrase